MDTVAAFADGDRHAPPLGPDSPQGNQPWGAGGIADHEQVLAGAEKALDDVDRALARLDEGTYGVCEVCGDTIDGDTLTASPTVRTCRAHLPLADRG